MSKKEFKLYKLRQTQILPLKLIFKEYNITSTNIHIVVQY